MPQPRLPDHARSRLIGTLGSVLVGAGGAVAGALPVRDPLTGLAAVVELRRYPGVGVLAVGAGLALLVAAWWGLGRSAPTARDLRITLLCWAIPLSVAPPLFSRDVYSYLAQGAMVRAGLDVYRTGPAALGGPLLAEVPAVWQHTPTPYGPVFLALATAVASVCGPHPVLGVLGLRLVSVASVALLAAVVPALARRYGVAPASALRLAVLNPLVLLHLVSGAHNDGPMVALTAAGLAVAAVYRRPALGTVLVTLAALVKAPAALGLLFLVPIWAGELAGPARPARAAAGTVGIAAGTAALVTTLTGTGYGWIGALQTPVSAHNWSLSSALGRITRLLLETLGSDLAAQAMAAWRTAGLVAGAALVVAAWLHRRRLGAVHALGLGLLAVVLCGPALRPWYLLWGLVPFAVAAPAGRARAWAAAASAGLTVVIMPNGFAPHPAQIGQIALGALVGLVLAAATLLPAGGAALLQMLPGRPARPTGPPEPAGAGAPA
ncbi:polyprenol phosphomannose-dependent alpha 1,6 mannosyltransferase MptB [Plantactinospora siamensis]|uniref:Polyprenol phosphomannose-dependent alpha 1,6 mannosyltransferase MptB n=1 Tax=Plantactinospora siamensis TaxID=555372 RepID=A0ABV6P183_9ACTN